MGIADVQPGKAGEQHRAHPFEAGPQGGPGQRARQRAGGRRIRFQRRIAARQRAGRGGEDGQEGRQQQHGGRQRRRQIAVAVQADEDPVQAQRVGGEAEQPAARPGLARRRRIQRHARGHGQRQHLGDGQGPAGQRAGSECQGVRRAGQCQAGRAAQESAARGGAHASVGLGAEWGPARRRTRSQRARRASPRATSMRRPSISA